MSRQLIRQLMYRPKPEIVAAFQQMQFCDDIYESYYSALANEAQTGQLKNYTLFAQFKRALKKTAVKIQDLAWPYGVAALLPGAETFVVSVEYSCVGDAEKLACTEDVQPAEKA